MNFVELEWLMADRFDIFLSEQRSCRTRRYVMKLRVSRALNLRLLILPEGTNGSCFNKAGYLPHITCFRAEASEYPYWGCRGWPED